MTCTQGEREEEDEEEEGGDRVCVRGEGVIGSGLVGGVIVWRGM